MSSCLVLSCLLVTYDCHYFSCPASQSSHSQDFAARMRSALSTSVTSSLGAKVEHAEMVANTTVGPLRTSGLPGLPSTELLANPSALLSPFFHYMLSTISANKRIFFPGHIPAV